QGKKADARKWHAEQPEQYTAPHGNSPDLVEPMLPNARRGFPFLNRGNICYRAAKAQPRFVLRRHAWGCQGEARSRSKPAERDGAARED
ncbi:MAG: hypothetical protein AB7E66_15135, partial [Parvibaculaceae bacterium]